MSVPRASSLRVECPGLSAALFQTASTVAASKGLPDALVLGCLYIIFYTSRSDRIYGHKPILMRSRRTVKPKHRDTSSHSFEPRDRSLVQKPALIALLRALPAHSAAFKTRASRLAWRLHGGTTANLRHRRAACDRPPGDPAADCVRPHGFRQVHASPADVARPWPAGCRASRDSPAAPDRRATT